VLRHDGLTAPLVVDCAINGELFIVFGVCETDVVTDVEERRHCGV